MAARRLTALIEREGEWFVSLCPELDIASQGRTVEEARAKLAEALEPFFETASEEEVQRRGAAARTKRGSNDDPAARAFE
ncbi:MAG: type II toxin-antitoxin system HicB family antitoxin [Dehalococcoidia bacterium]